MRRRALSARIASFALAGLFASVALPVPAAAKPTAKPAGNKTACLAAHEEGQALRTQKKPHAAREKFVSCARAECPVVVRKECVDQLALAEKDAPTVALEAHDEAGMDATAVKVAMDGAPLAERLTGTAVDVEPGEHVFRFVRADGKAIEQRVLVVEGDKNRKVVADFASLVPKPPPPDDGPRPPQPARPIPIPSIALGGVAVLGLGSFAFFALTGKSKENKLATSCGPRCSDDDVSPVKTSYVVADISLAVGIVAAAVAVVLAWPAITGAPQTSASITRTPLPFPPPPWMPLVRVRP
jgi:hypothetical protein